MESFAYVEEEKKELAKEMHRLACLEVLLMDSDERGVIIQNEIESSLAVKVKKSPLSTSCVEEKPRRPEKFPYASCTKKAACGLSSRPNNLPLDVVTVDFIWLFWSFLRLSTS